MEKKPKKVLVAMYGSRGDIQPLLAFALALRDAGHDVTFQSTTNFKATILKYNFRYVPLSGDPEAAIQSEAFKMVMKTGDMRYVASLTDGPASSNIAEEIADAIANHQVVIVCGLIAQHAFLIHRKTKVPVMIAMLTPQFPTRQFGFPFGGSVYFANDPEVNWKSWEDNLVSTLGFFGAAVPGLTEKWNLAKITHPLGFWWDLFYVDKIPMIGCFSAEAIGGRPKDWPEHVQICGHLDLDLYIDPTLKLDANLEDFLQKHPEDKPIFLSFGSMPIDPNIIISLGMSIVEKLGRRLILSAGWSGLKEEDTPNNEKLLMIKGAPYCLLFPRCSVIIHHGGAGTTGAALKSGAPQIILSVFGNQVFYAEAMYHIGVGSKPLQFRTMKEEEVLEAIKFVDDERIRKNAQEIGLSIGKKNSAIAAVQIFEDFFEKYSSKLV